MTNKLEAIVDAELKRLGWLATGDQPCLAVTHADPKLPYGWVRVIDDYTVLAVGDAIEIASALSKLEAGAEYGVIHGLPLLTGHAVASRDWPRELFLSEQLEEGDITDNPLTLFTLATNAGIRYAAGPHGVSYCALFEWQHYLGCFATSRDDAINWSSTEVPETE